MTWTVGGVKMYEARQWLKTAALYLLIVTASCAKPHRRSMASQQTLPLSKGGWRPVIGQGGGFLFGYNTAPLHAPQYKIPVPVLDYSTPTSQRPHPTRDAGKLTSIAQAYRPTTLRTVPSPPLPAASQPINSYLNPFSLPNNLAHYKFVQNFPVDNVMIRNPHNPYAARPVYKYPTKFKQQYPNQYQQLMTVQPIQFGQYQTAKPLDHYGKPMDNYAKPSNQKPQTGGTEIYKTEVYKLQDSDTAPAINQQVKTAQQSLVTPKVPTSPFPQFAFSEQVLPASIFGSFGSFGVQSAKGRDPFYPARTTYIPPLPSKQTIFNSYSFAPNFKTTPQFATTTPRLQPANHANNANKIHYETSLTWNDYKHIPTQATKLSVAPAKIDPNSNKGTFKPSPQDPFSKHFNLQDYKVSTYKPTVQTTTFSYSSFHPAEYTPGFFSQQQQNAQSNYNNHQNQNSNNEKKKSKIHDSVAAGVNQQTGQQYASPPKSQEGTHNAPPHHATYEVTESYSEDDGHTHSSQAPWSATPETYKFTDEAVTKLDYSDYSRPATTPVFPDEFAIVTETDSDKGYENSLSYDNPVESQSRRPSGDDFEPIGKHKLKDYYYKVSTPTYENHDHSTRRTKKPSAKKTHEATQSSVNKEINDVTLDALPTLPPNKHFKRPNAPEPVDKDKIRKRNKVRRRRPQGGNGNNSNKETNTRKYSTTESHTTEETHTIRPRLRSTQSKQNGATTPTISTDQTTSAVPTVSPTSPTITKKKLINRRPYTTTERAETTTSGYRDYESNKESPIMKISAASRVQHPKPSTTPYEYKNDQTPDYSHKQDEKDTPTSDVSVVSLNDLKSTKAEAQKAFSFHRDLKPIDPKQETTTDSSGEDSNEVTTTSKTETTPTSVKSLRPRLKNKYDRPRFSVKDYRNRLSSTTSTEKPSEAPAPKIRFPHRRIPVSENKTSENENKTERKKFTAKEQRHNANRTEETSETEKDIHSVRPIRQRHTTAEPEVTHKISSRIRNGSRRPRPTEETTEASSRRPLRKKIKDSEQGESTHDLAVETTASSDKGDTTTSERTRSESAIMKIADKKHHDRAEHTFEHSKRVSDLTLAASKDYNTPGMFKTVSSNSRRIPNYFTIATDDPILPIEAFFPQINNNQKKEP